MISQRSSIQAGFISLQFRKGIPIRYALLVTLLMALPVQSGGLSAQQLLPFSIPESSAEAGLTLYVEQAGRQVLFPYDVIRSKTTNAVVGKYGADEALDILLKDTGLKAFSSKGTLTIRLLGKREEKSKMLVNKKKGMWGVAALASLFATTGPAHAESAVVAGLEEIVVTARKVKESLQDVPISVQAFSAQNLSAQGLSNVSEIGDLTSNMEFDALSPINGSSNTPNINIRGIGTTDFLLTVDPSVGVYVDGIYVARSVGGLLDLLDLEQIEVLKGPQGTLFGRNTVGGAIQLITRKPTDEFRFSAEATTGEDNRRDFRFNVSGGLAENLFASLAFSTKNRDGYGKRRDFFADNPDLAGLEAAINGIKAYDEATGALLSGNTTGLAPGSIIAGGITAQPSSGDDPGNENNYSIRTSLVWEVSDTFAATFSVDYNEADETAPALVLLDIFQDDLSAPTPGVANPLTGNEFAPNIVASHTLAGFEAGTTAFSEDRFVIGDKYSTYATGPGASESETIGYSLTLDAEISDTVSFKSITAYRDLESVFGQDPDHSPFLLDAHTNDYTHEQLSQEFQLLGNSEQLKWVLGFYYFEEEGVDEVVVPLLHGLAVLDERNEVDNSAWAAFGQGTYHFANEATSLTLGLRYTDEDKEYIQTHLDCGIANALGVPDGFVVNNCNSLSTGTADESFTNLSYTVSLAHRWTDDVMTYLSYSTGYKSGGFSGRTVAFIPDQTPFPFNEEEASTFEVGVKSSWFDNRLRLNAALFDTSFEDLQVTIQSGVAPITANAAEASIKGFELDMMAAVTDNLQLTLAVGLLDGEYDEKPSQLGDNLVNAPESTINFGFVYDVPLNNAGSLVLRGDYTYKSKIYNNAENTDLLTQSSIGLLDASISWISPDAHYTATLGGKNLTDEEHLITGFFQPGVGYTEAVYARPNEWYLSLKYNF